MLRVRVVGNNWQGGPSLNTLYFLTPLQDVDAALRVVNAVRAQWQTDLRAEYATFISHQVSGDVDVIDSATGLITDTLSVATPAPTSGSGAPSTMSIATALCLRLKTGTFIAGRRLQGRMFLSPLSSDRADPDGSPTVTARDIANQFATNLRAALAAGDTQVVWHRPVAGAGGVAAPIISTSVADKFAVLRSRRD